MSAPRSRLRWLAVVLAVISAAAFAGGVALGALFGSVDFESVTMVIVVAAILGVGGLLSMRVPGNPIGWLLLATGGAWSALVITEAYARHGIAVAPGSLPGTTLALWFATWLWIPGLVIVPAFAVLLFPDGRLPSRRWRPVLWSAVVGLGLVVLAQWTVGWGVEGYSYPFAPDARNPIHLPALEPGRIAMAILGGVLLAVGVVGGLLSSVLRFRRARGDERQQMKWVVLGVTTAFVLFALSIPFLVVLERLGAMPDFHVEGVFVGLALGAFPVTMAIAVLRYRLYDIDRIISRTVSYAVISLIMLAIYVAGVVSLGGLARSVASDGGDLVVAVSTLFAAAAFGPLRRRVRAAVDRRFARTRYDAHRTVEAFARRLRDEVDLEVLSRELSVVVTSTIRPAHVGMWLREVDHA